MSLKEPYFLRKPSAKLVGKDRAAAVARVLAEFLSQYTRYSTQYNTHSIQYSTLHYTRETECHVQAEADTEARVPAEIFQSFLLHASEAGEHSHRQDGDTHQLLLQTSRACSPSRPSCRAALTSSSASACPRPPGDLL